MNEDVLKNGFKLSILAAIFTLIVAAVQTPWISGSLVNDQDFEYNVWSDELVGLSLSTGNDDDSLTCSEYGTEDRHKSLCIKLTAVRYLLRLTLIFLVLELAIPAVVTKYSLLKTAALFSLPFLALTTSWLLWLTFSSSDKELLVGPAEYSYEYGFYCCIASSVCTVITMAIALYTNRQSQT